MYFRLLYRAAALRKGQAVAALTAIVVAAAAATAMLNLFVDVQAKLRKEFRNFGANLVVEAKSGSFAPEQISTIESVVVGFCVAEVFGRGSGGGARGSDSQRGRGSVYFASQRAQCSGYVRGNGAHRSGRRQPGVYVVAGFSFVDGA